jgi:Uma2 family endonuclease
VTPSTSKAVNLRFDKNLSHWQLASWDDYVAYRDDPNLERLRLFFNQGYLLVDMGSEGINHASISDLFPILFFIWFRKIGQPFKSYGRCLIEKANHRAASPDQVIYVGKNYPQWREGEPRRINLNEWRVPDLVGEVSDTTLATDLDEKKHLYSGLGVPEYWVVDVEGGRVLAFQLQQDGRYQQSEYSKALEGLPIILLEETIKQLTQGTTDSAASWFAERVEEL